MEGAKFLLNWILRDIKQKDVFFKRIQNIEEDEHSALITYKDKKVNVIPLVDLDDEGLAKVYFQAESNEHITIATFNKKENIQSMIKSWDDLCNIRFLCIYFINPFSNPDNKWIIFPHTHAKVTEKKALRTGLASLGQSVAPFTEHDLRRIPDDGEMQI